MSNPLISQGTLNRILAGVVFSSFPQLNIISGFLGKEGISFAMEGNASQLIPTMTGAVTSPEPYVMVTATIHMVKTQGMAAVYQNQFNTNTSLGSMTVVPDSVAFLPFSAQSCVLESFNELPFNGTQAEFVVKIKGVYPINSALFLVA